MLVAPLCLLFAACGEEQKTEEVVKLETYKDKLSYCMGADFANPIIQAGAEADFLNFDMVATGFKDGLNDGDYSACQQTVMDAFGARFMDIDSTKIDAGSECFGKLNGSSLYSILKEVERLDQFDMEKLAIGFRHALMKSDTLVEKMERAKILQEFQTEVQTAQMEKMQKLDQPFLEKAKSVPGAKVIDGGIVIETIKEGKGGSPAMTDDVEAHYILTNPAGDTLESSVDMGQALKINLQGVIAGWTMSFTQLKKGGKYRLYIPSDLAYGKGALCFYVELIDFGPAGTIAPPRQQQPY